MSLHTSLISLPDLALENIFSFVGSKANLCKKIKDLQEERARILGTLILNSHAEDDFFTRVQGKSFYRLDFSVDNISSLPSEDTWNKLKREFVGLRELRVQGGNLSLIQQIIRVFREISHLSITIKQATRGNDDSARRVIRDLEDLRNLKAIQLRGVKSHVVLRPGALVHVERVDFTDSDVNCIDYWGDNVVGLSRDIIPFMKIKF